MDSLARDATTQPVTSFMGSPSKRKAPWLNGLALTFARGSWHGHLNMLRTYILIQTKAHDKGDSRSMACRSLLLMWSVGPLWQKAPSPLAGGSETSSKQSRTVHARSPLGKGMPYVSPLIKV